MGVVWGKHAKGGTELDRLGEAESGGGKKQIYPKKFPQGTALKRRYLRGNTEKGWMSFWGVEKKPGQ